MFRLLEDVIMVIFFFYFPSGQGPDEDTTAPVITGCPLNAISVSAPPGSNSATVIWTEPTATDDSGVAPTRSRSHAPGQSFPVGTTVVIYRFTDASGNSDACQFQVIVVGWYWRLHSDGAIVIYA